MELEQAKEIISFCAKSSKFPLEKFPILTDFRFESIEHNAKGAFWIDKKGNPVIYLDLNYSDVAWVITHEWVHFLQWFRGDLRFDLETGEAFYLGRNIKDLPYYSRPEEKEAREAGEILWRAWNRQNRG